MRQILSYSLIGQLIIAVGNFQKFSDRSFVNVFEPFFFLKLYWTVHCTVTSKTQKDHLSNKFFLTISSTVSLRVLEVSE